jgi:DNA polymerase V
MNTKNHEELIFHPTVGEQSIFISVLGNVPAGFPSPALDYLEDRLDLSKTLITNPTSTFIIKVTGDSMIDALIFPGSLLIVDRSIRAESGMVCLCTLDRDFTVKRFKREIATGKVYLLPENKKYPIIEITSAHDFEVWGVVTWIIRRPT